MNIQQYFRQSCNKRRIHLVELEVIRKNENLDKAARQRLDKQIADERQRLAIIDEMWNVVHRAS